MDKKYELHTKNEELYQPDNSANIWLKCHILFKFKNFWISNRIILTYINLMKKHQIIFKQVQLTTSNIF